MEQLLCVRDYCRWWRLKKTKPAFLRWLKSCFWNQNSSLPICVPLNCEWITFPLSGLQFLHHLVTDDNTTLYGRSKDLLQSSESKSLQRLIQPKWSHLYHPPSCCLARWCWQTPRPHHAFITLSVPSSFAQLSPLKEANDDQKIAPALSVTLAPLIPFVLFFSP